MPRMHIIHPENLFCLLNSYSRDHKNTYCLFQLDINIVKNSTNIAKSEIWRKGWDFNPFTERMVGANKSHSIGGISYFECLRVDPVVIAATLARITNDGKRGSHEVIRGEGMAHIFGGAAVQPKGVRWKIAVHGQDRRWIDE
ncbi:hypothetical protein DFH08DRAFT_795777 [Mycena albidolilacea]|uniref:Uncharacterized protein n=1 Tax=Mycena albidolilacea TaxID=1033008 RepID=A0AAD7F6E0_9AGAR|nr:hypothetical protein DFH08DRAFT_795777 [Mycena albidolilacea]